ncbi:PAS domain-containing protein [Hansschlegelia sp. KR7-227]|uniref:PAS domain-containing protein n=1 Tax=Hansschlegelia sp. KR7-227 TaxID=3400914 RepID=UPI003BFBA0EA
MEPSRTHEDGDGATSAALVAAASAALSGAGGDVDILRHSDLAMCVVAAVPELPIVYANPAFLTVTGYSAEETLGQSCRFLLGPDTDPRDVQRFRKSLADGRPFQTSIVSRRKGGGGFRNSLFVTPVRDDEGAVGRYIGILVPEAPPVDAGDVEARIGALRHKFRNQLQSMTSLVGLLGQRLPPGDGREAFVDLRARFEATALAQSDSFALDDGERSRALSQLAHRLAQLYDTAGRHKVTIAAGPVKATARRAESLAQILTELIIDLFRNGFGDGPPATGRIEVAANDDGGVRLRVFHPGPVAESGPAGSTELGLAIAQSLVRGLGGQFLRRRDKSLTSEAVLPAEGEGR